MSHSRNIVAQNIVVGLLNTPPLRDVFPHFYPSRADDNPVDAILRELQDIEASYTDNPVMLQFMHDVVEAHYHALKPSVLSNFRQRAQCHFNEDEQSQHNMRGGASVALRTLADYLAALRLKTGVTEKTVLTDAQHDLIKLYKTQNAQNPLQPIRGTGRAAKAILAHMVEEIKDNPKTTAFFAPITAGALIFTNGRLPSSGGGHYYNPDITTAGFDTDTLLAMADGDVTVDIDFDTHAAVDATGAFCDRHLAYLNDDLAGFVSDKPWLQWIDPKACLKPDTMREDVTSTLESWAFRPVVG